MNVGQNEENSNWHKRLRLRKNSFPSSCEEHSAKQEKKTSEKRAESLQNDQTVNDSKMKLMLFSCDTCGFSTSMFSTLQHHRIMHKNCVFTCTVYNDNVQQTFHEENISNVEFKSEVSADAAGEEHKRLVAACRHRWSRRNWWRKREPDIKLAHDFKFFLPKAEAQWTSPVFPISAPGLLDNRGVLLDPEKTLQETQQFLERTPSAGKKCPVLLKTEFDQTKPLLSRPRERTHNAPHPELISSLMEKNNISVPPDCTTKVLGFKMVDGKKHLILKVIPSNRRDASSPGKSKCVESPTANDQPWLKRDGSTLKNSSEEVLTAEAVYCPNEALCESQQNFTTSQRVSGCHGDVASRPSPDTGSSEERCHSRFITEKEFQCSDVTDVNTDSPSPLKDFCQIESEISDVLFHSCAHDENTNNTNPRDAQLPEDKCECERRTTPRSISISISSISSASHQLDTRLTSSASHHHITDAEGITQQRELISTDVFSALPVDSVVKSVCKQKRVVKVLLNQESQKTWSPEEIDIHWEPVPRDVPRSLRLRPHRSSQFITIPRDKQPVIVLNHPDADIPEVFNIMKVIHKHKGAAQRVALCRKTLSALSELSCERHRRAWPDGPVKERFSLKLRLKRVCGRKFTVVQTVPESIVPQPTFRCWFCGRLFQNQEVWVGHGQRHLTEATRDWNHIFNT